MISIKSRNIIVKPTVIICALTLNLIGTRISAQEQWDAYQSRTLGQIVKLHALELGESRAQVTFLLTAESFPSKVRVVYTGKSREITPRRREVISEWAKARKVSKEVVDLFEHELLFVEGSKEYWIPVQEQLIPYLRRDVKTGETVELLVIWIGARKEMRQVEWVFLVNEFLHK